ncbi:hypothetical protein BKM17_26455 [Pseudomonas syringae group genomosp. 3]|nr:hypothetical protein BKM17_26455 [Pseudomonas syringae group genomosp. 3]
MTEPVNARGYEAYDEKIRTQAEMLTSLLSAGLETQEAADAAVSALNKLREEVQKQTSSIRKDLSSLADATATEAAKLLVKKLAQANDAVDAAAERYEKAGRLLGVKTFAALVVSLTIGCTVAWYLVSPLLPSREEIAFRRTQIAEMDVRAAALARKGVHLEWTGCQTGLLKKTKPCFRTDGEVYSIEGTDRHYALPYNAQP